MERDCDEFPLHRNTLMKSDSSIIPRSPFLMAIFSYDEEKIAMSLVIKKIIQKKQLADVHNMTSVDIGDTKLEEKDAFEKNFYLAFLYFLDEEIENIKKESKEDGEFVSNLITIKYYLMMALDSVYGANLFLNPTNYNFELSSVPGNAVTYIFIDDLLEYRDIEYGNDYDGKVGEVNRLNNLLKKLFIKTDYFLTKDGTILEHIYDNINYGTGNYTISTDMLDEIVSLKRVDRNNALKMIRRRIKGD